jgi:hypothetical protein
MVVLHLGLPVMPVYRGPEGERLNVGVEFFPVFFESDFGKWIPDFKYPGTSLEIPENFLSYFCAVKVDVGTNHGRSRTTPSEKGCCPEVVDRAPPRFSLPATTNL